MMGDRMIQLTLTIFFVTGCTCRVAQLTETSQATSSPSDTTSGTTGGGTSTDDTTGVAEETSTISASDLAEGSSLPLPRELPSSVVVLLPSFDAYVPPELPGPKPSPESSPEPQASSQTPSQPSSQP
ncbi:uncharacterized protein LOC143027106 isoform X1 [Oratosquilla oratoria]|uniref:uncharacterized protein LOC143027106 isoform X1 n=1 Tax=Oratosquilla oratoria TaxID=337810 RepID=UPI003F76DC59